MLQLIQQIILVFGSTVGALTDAKTGYIYDWITYPMIGIGIILSAIQGQWNNIMAGIIIFGAMYIAYKYGKIGGGDVKLFLGIALLNPANNYLFLVAVLLFMAGGALIFYSTYYFVKYARKGINLEENKKGITKAIIFGAITTLYLCIITTQGLIGKESAEIIGIPIMFGLVFVAFQEGIKKNFFEKKIKIKELEEDEVIAEERNPSKILKLLKGKQLIGENEKKLLKKNGVKYIYVLRGLPPLGPFILLGIIGAILQPEILILLFR
jgi:Flp pilus assembly protein protease CpaA